MQEHAQKGGEARAAALAPEERRRIAREAVEARWRRQKGGEYLRGYLDGYAAAMRRVERHVGKEAASALEEVERLRVAEGR